MPIGLGTGLLVGAHAGKDKTIQLEGKSESEVSQALAYLRKKARIRDYK
jgi:ribosomal protein L6P/L9E